MQRLEYKWTILFQEGELPPTRFTPKELKTLRRLGDRGLLFTCSYPGTALNFGVRFPGAKGQLPFTTPTNKEGDYVGVVNIEAEDRIALLDAQRWSVLEAYKLGLADGERRAMLTKHQQPGDGQEE